MIYYAVNLLKEDNEMKVIELTFNILNNTRRVSKLPVDKEDIANYYYTIDAINQLPWRSTTINGQLLDEYRILDKFSGFILPSRVSLGAEIKYANLMETNQLKFSEGRGKLLDSTEFNSFSTKICAALRIECNLKPVTEFRIEKLLSTVEGHEVLNDMINYTSGAYQDFVPLKLKVLSLEEYYYNVDLDTHFENYLFNRLVK